MDEQCAALTLRGRRCTRDGIWRACLYLCRQHWEHLHTQLREEQREAAERWARTEQTRIRTGVVYYVQRADELVKIGTSMSLESRLATLRREHGPLVLLATHTGGYPAEQALHTRFADDRVEGEWFLPSEELLEHVARMVRRHPLERASA